MLEFGFCASTGGGIVGSAGLMGVVGGGVGAVDVGCAAVGTVTAVRAGGGGVRVCICERRGLRVAVAGILVSTDTAAFCGRAASLFVGGFGKGWGSSCEGRGRYFGFEGFWRSGFWGGIGFWVEVKSSGRYKNMYGLTVTSSSLGARFALCSCLCALLFPFLLLFAKFFVAMITGCSSTNFVLGPLSWFRFVVIVIIRCRIGRQSFAIRGCR